LYLPLLIFTTRRSGGVPEVLRARSAPAAACTAGLPLQLIDCQGTECVGNFALAVIGHLAKSSLEASESS
jgi:hypothetical protein